jgi:hypothetical protein
MAVNFNPRSNHIKPLVTERSLAFGHLAFSSPNSISRVWADWGLAAWYALTFFSRQLVFLVRRTRQLTAMLPFRSFWTTVNAGLPNRPVGELRSFHQTRIGSPKILTRLSEASQKSAVSTPCSVTLISA